MKKLLLLLAVVAAFTCTSVAQYGSSSGAGQTSEQKTTDKATAKKSAGSSKSAMPDEKGGKAKKEATLTGCLGAQPDASGNYMLTNGKYKKGVQVSPADKVKDHAGHKVQLSGQWSGDKKSFEAASLKHISETCEAAAGAGATKKHKDTSAAPPKS